MECPKCGAQVEDTITTCPYCNETLESPAAATDTAAKKTNAPKIDLKKIDFKSKKTWAVLAGAVAAIILLIVIICAIVSAINTPQNIAENYVEAYLDGDLKAVLKKSAPWVVRDLAVDLDLKESASASKVAKEYEEYEEFEKAEGKAEVIRSEVLEWYDNEYNAASSSVFYHADGMKFSEAKKIQEYAEVRVYYTLTQKGEEAEEYSHVINLVKIGGSWQVLNEID